MLAATLNDPSTYQIVLTHAVWKEAFGWLHEHRDQLPDDGEYNIDGQDLRAIVQTVKTQPRSQRVFEAHQREIDLQYCFSGSEIIEWVPVNLLTANTKYDKPKDYTLYDAPPSNTAIRLTPGTFAIFLPADAHMPGIRWQHDTTRKVVIKIPLKLLQ